MNSSKYALREIIFKGLFFLFFFNFFLTPQCYGETTIVAVASNFSKAMEEISQAFHASTGHRAELSFGSSGKFVTQLSHGAPYEVFLSADDKGPRTLEEEGYAVSGSRFTYALGTLVLWSNKDGYIDSKGSILSAGDFKHLAIADPSLAPYGRAAVEFLKNKGLFEKLTSTLVYGENISQTYNFVLTENAELGFVALSQVLDNGFIGRGSSWIVAKELYSEIRQDALLMKSGERNPAAKALLSFLKTPEAISIIKKYGYDLP